MTTAATAHSPNRRVLRNAEYAGILLPFVLSTMTQPLLSAVDTAVMGRLSDPSYIAGVAVGAVIFNTVYWLLGFLRVGSTGFSAQASAEGGGEALYKALLPPGVMALGLSLAILLLRRPIFEGAMLLLRLDAPSRAVASTYYFILVWGAPLVLLNYVVLGWLMGLSRIRATLFMQIGSNVLNMILDILFVGVFGGGVEGVAAATLIALLFAFVAGMLSLRRALFSCSPPEDGKPAGLRALLRTALNPADMWRIAKVNGHLFLRTVCMLAQTNIFMATASGFGTVTLSANAILIQIMLIFSYVFEGIANASSVFAGRASGTGNRELMEDTRRMTLRWTLGSAVFMTAVYGLWQVPALSLFTDLPDVLAEAARYAPWGLAFPLLAGAGLTYYGMFTGSSVTRPVFISTLQALIAFIAVWAAAVPLLGNDGLWLAYLVFYWGRSAFLVRHMADLKRIRPFSGE